MLQAKNERRYRLDIASLPHGRQAVLNCEHAVPTPNEERTLLLEPAEAKVIVVVPLWKFFSSIEHYGRFFFKRTPTG